MPFKFAYRFFAVLDIISIVMLGKQVFSIVQHIGEIPDQSLSKIRIGITVLLFLLLFVSAAGLMMLKKWGAIAYYIQFPFRLVVWGFSFGFVTLFYDFTEAQVLDWVFRILMVLEFMRLYFTVQLQREYFR
ncbi:MAG: hypothetical protein K0S09_969 [Sphingobacteriaceae bacterium]|jgi:hypothetical protein|nr:hypothetical protein [Sphingobacteriaceae bacterium]